MIAIEQNAILSDMAKMGSLYFLYASVSACYVTTLSEALKLEAAAASATALTVIFRACERSDDESLRRLGRLEVIVFASMDTFMRDCLVHEMGHAITAIFFYSKAKPKITIIPFAGGMTEYSLAGLTAFGKSLGRKNVELIITAAGPLASYISSLSILIISRSQRERNPKISKYLQVAALMNIGSCLEYAASALWTHKDFSHDFVALSRGGYHPVPIIVTMVAIPAILEKGLNYLEENP